MQEWDEFNLNLLVHIIQQEEFSTIVKGFISLGESRSDFFYCLFGVAWTLFLSHFC